MMIKHVLMISLLAASLSAQASHPEAAGVGQAILKRPQCFKWGGNSPDSEVITLPGEQGLLYVEKIGLARKIREVDTKDYLKEARQYRFHGTGSPFGKVHVFALTDEGKQIFSPEKGGICHKVAYTTKVLGWTEPKEGPDGLPHTYITYEWRSEYLKPEWRAVWVEHFMKEPTEKGTTTARLIKKNGKWVFSVP